MVSLKLTSSRFKDFGLLILPETLISHFGEIPESSRLKIPRLQEFVKQSTGICQLELIDLLVGLDIAAWNPGRFQGFHHK